MANLDRFSQPMTGERYFEDMKPICQCEMCGNDLYEGDEIIKTDKHKFCDKTCFLDWAMEEFDAVKDELEAE